MEYISNILQPTLNNTWLPEQYMVCNQFRSPNGAIGLLHGVNNTWFHIRSARQFCANRHHVLLGLLYFNQMKAFVISLPRNRHSISREIKTILWLLDESSDARNSSNVHTKSHVLKNRTYFQRKTRTCLIIMFFLTIYLKLWMFPKSRF